MLRLSVIEDLEIVLGWLASADEMRLWAGPKPIYQSATVDIWHAIDADTQPTFSLLDDAGCLQGFAQVISISNEYPTHLARVIINPALRRQGIGRSLLEQVIKELRRRENSLRLSLNVYAENDLAIKLYRSMGFKEVKRNEESGLITMTLRSSQ